MLMALLCRLVRAAHNKGANIVLIQVCILKPWMSLAVFPTYFRVFGSS